jgi:hypothetical protein
LVAAFDGRDFDLIKPVGVAVVIEKSRARYVPSGIRLSRSRKRRSDESISMRMT